MSDRLVPERVRVVWAHVTACPTISAERLMERTGYGRAAIFWALKRLEDMGYIARPEGTNGVRIVTIGFYPVAAGGKVLKNWKGNRGRMRRVRRPADR